MGPVLCQSREVRREPLLLTPEVPWANGADRHGNYSKSNCPNPQPEVPGDALETEGPGQGARVCSPPLLLGKNHHPSWRWRLEVLAAKWRKRPCAQLPRCLSWQQKCMLWEHPSTQGYFLSPHWCWGKNHLTPSMCMWYHSQLMTSVQEQGGILDPSCLSLTSNPWSTMSVQPLKQILLFGRLGAYGILVPRPGVELRPSAMKANSSNHWTAREVL